MAGLIDSTVVIHLFRKNRAAQSWIDTQEDYLFVTPITWLEVMFGAPGKAGQATSKAILSRFDMLYLTAEDIDWAMQQMELHRLSQGVGINDCLIASVCHRLQMPIYTHNLKDMRKVLDPSFVIQPY
jgi:predicted nucleic acid-binding protein